jgi:magnesium chelatase family protein
LIDRVDLRVTLAPLATGSYAGEVAESSAVVRERVAAARCAAAQRWREHGWSTNAEVPGHVLRQRYRLPRKALHTVEEALRRGSLTARGADRAMRVAWTLADLRGAELPAAGDVAAALNFRERRDR